MGVFLIIECRLISSKQFSSATFHEPMKKPTISNKEISSEFEGIEKRLGAFQARRVEAPRDAAIEVIYTVRRGDGKEAEAIAAAIYHTGITENDAIELYQNCFSGQLRNASNTTPTKS